MDRLRRTATVLRYIFLLGLWGLPILRIAACWLFEAKDAESPTPFHFGMDLPPGLTITEPLTPAQHLWLLAANLLPMALTAGVCYYLARLFGGYAKGRIFTADAVSSIRRLGWLLLTGQLVSPLNQAAESLALTYRNPVGHRMLAIGFNQTHLEFGLIAVIVLLVAWVMDEGRKLQEEQELTI